jgi:protein SCO1/2
MKKLRLVLWVGVALLAAAVSYAFVSQNSKPGQTQQAVKPLGAPFNLVDHEGKPITRDDIMGRHHAIFFGFTNCPDVCPATLLEVSSWIKDLGSESDKLDFYFFTVDPERDNPEVMKDYVTAFDPRITGVTGDPEEMSKTLSAYKIYSKKVDLGDGDGDYTMDHSAFIMMFKPDGSFKGTISFGENDDIALEKLRRLVKNS